jgi:hypothetical protein
MHLNRIVPLHIKSEFENKHTQNITIKLPMLELLRQLRCSHVVAKVAV